MKCHRPVLYATLPSTPDVAQLLSDPRLLQDLGINSPLLAQDVVITGAVSRGTLWSSRCQVSALAWPFGRPCEIPSGCASI